MSDATLSESDTWSDEESPETSDYEFINDSDTDYSPSEDGEETDVSEDSYFDSKDLKRKFEEDAEKRQEDVKQLKDLLFKQSAQLEAMNKGLDTLEKFKSYLENTKATIPNVGSVVQPPPLDKSPAEANADNQ